MEQKTGILASISILAALASYVLTFTGSPVWGLIVALLAIPLGIGGFVMSASPRVGGGLLSVIAIVIAVLAIGVAIIGTMGVIIF